MPDFAVGAGKSASPFKKAAERYLEVKASDAKRLRRIIKEIGHFHLEEITPAENSTCANCLCPGQKNSSMNRQLVTPICSVMHYVADNGWCDWVKVTRFKAAAPSTRAMRPELAPNLMDAAAGELKALLIFLFGHEMCISDAIQLTWAHLDLAEGLIYLHTSKTDEWKWKALHEALEAALAGLEGERTGRAFPWETHWGVYGQLKKVKKATGIDFTPRVARHSLGAWPRAAVTSLKTIKDTLNHTDLKSSMHDQMTELPEQRAALAAVGLVPKQRGKA